MPVTRTINATEFKAKCLDILDRLSAHQLDRVIVTKHGKPVAVLTPPETEAAAVRGLHGFMRGAVTIAADVDLTAPVSDEPFAAASGLLHG